MKGGSDGVHLSSSQRKNLGHCCQAQRSAARETTEQAGQTAIPPPRASDETQGRRSRQGIGLQKRQGDETRGARTREDGGQGASKRAGQDVGS